MAFGAAHQEADGVRRWFQSPAHGWFQLFFDPSDPVLAHQDALRVVRLGTVERQAPEGVQVFARKTIARWKEETEFPAGESEEMRDLYGQAFQVPRILDERHHHGTKVGGWASWIQDGATPRVDGRPLSLLVQLSRDPEGWMWGFDAGKLYVFADEALTTIRWVVQYH